MSVLDLLSRGDAVSNAVALVLLLKGLSVARSPDRTIASRLGDINMLLLLTLLLLSPNWSVPPAASAMSCFSSSSCLIWQVRSHGRYKSCFSY